MKRKQIDNKRRQQIDAWMQLLQEGASKHRERVNQNLAKGRVWSEERKAAWSARAAKTWTPEMREAARQRALARHAAKGNERIAT